MRGLRVDRRLAVELERELAAPEVPHLAEVPAGVEEGDGGALRRPQARVEGALVAVVDLRLREAGLEKRGQGGGFAGGGGQGEDHLAARRRPAFAAAAVGQGADRALRPDRHVLTDVAPRRELAAGRKGPGVQDPEEAVVAAVALPDDGPGDLAQEALIAGPGPCRILEIGLVERRQFGQRAPHPAPEPGEDQLAVGEVVPHDVKVHAALDPSLDRPALPQVQKGIAVAHQEAVDLGIVRHQEAPEESLEEPFRPRHQDDLRARGQQAGARAAGHAVVAVEAAAPLRIEVRRDAGVFQRGAAVALLPSPEAEGDHVACRLVPPEVRDRDLGQPDGRAPLRGQGVLEA